MICDTTATASIGNASDVCSVRKTVPVVYFNKVTTPIEPDGLLKIGFSRDQAERNNKQNKSVNGVSFKHEEICVVRGFAKDEKKVHHYFGKYRFPAENERELFYPAPEVMDYVRWLYKQYFVWVPSDANCPPINEMEHVEATQWLPNSERKASLSGQLSLFGGGPFDMPGRVITMDDYYTPPVVIKAARQAMGGIDVDPATHAYANMVVQAKTFFTVQENGLTKQWAGSVWVNPPFSEWGTWAPKIQREWESGRVSAMCIYAASPTITAEHFSPIHRIARGLCVIQGRIPCWGGKSTTPPSGHVVYYAGNEMDRFANAFANIGFVFKAHGVC